MKISIISGYNETPTGIVTYCNNVTSELKKISDVEIYRVPMTEIRIMGKHIGGFLLPFFYTICLPLGKSDIVHSLDPAFLHPKTNIVTMPDLMTLTRFGIYGNIKRFGLNLVKRFKDLDCIITVSNYVARQIENELGIDKDKIKVVYNGINLDVFRPAYWRPEEIRYDKNNIVFVGDFIKRKNALLVAKALKILGNNYRLIRIGASRDYYYKQNFLNYVKKHNLDVIDKGYISLSLLPNYYTFADVFVFPSRDEGFGMPPMEAMACGTTCVLSDIPVFREIYQDMAYYSKFDEYDLASKIEMGVSCKKDKLALIKYARKFSWKNNAAQLLKIYYETL